jgi:hypothetical protein
MRRIKQYSLIERHWSHFPDHVAVIDMRDMRKLLAVARAACQWRVTDPDMYDRERSARQAIVDTVDRLNAKPKARKAK